MHKLSSVIAADKQLDIISGSAGFIAHQPAILLLDEATSHLDAIAESLIEQNLHRLACTRIAIAHRLKA